MGFAWHRLDVHHEATTPLSWMSPLKYHGKARTCVAVYAYVYTPASLQVEITAVITRSAVRGLRDSSFKGSLSTAIRRHYASWQGTKGHHDDTSQRAQSPDAGSLARSA